MSFIEKEKLIKADIVSIENRVRHAFNQGYDLGFKDGKKAKPQDIDYKAQYERLSQKAEIVISQLRADRDRLIRPKGHWICDGKGRSFADYHCSECGLKLALCGQDIKQRQDSGYSLFCGGCGADMREVVEE